MPRLVFAHFSSTGTRLCVIAISLSLAVPFVGLGQSSNETALRVLVDRFFAAYQRKDLEGLMTLWTKKAANFGSSKEAFKTAFATGDKIKLKDLTVNRITIDGQKAVARVVFHSAAAEPNSEKSSVASEKSHRIMHFVKESGAWKVARFANAEVELAASLVAAETDEARKAILESEKDFEAAQLVQALIEAGRPFEDEGDYPRALAIYNLSLTMADRYGGKLERSSALLAIGHVHNLQSSFDQALESYRESLKLAEELNAVEPIGRVVNAIGTVYLARGEYNVSLEYFNKSLAIGETRRNQRIILGALSNIGEVHRSLGDYASALEVNRKSLAIASEIGNKAATARVVNNIGVVHEAQGNYMLALEYFQKSLSLGDELRYKWVTAGALNNIGIIHDKQGNYAVALRYYERSLELSNELGDKLEVARTLNNIGFIHQMQGHHSRALECYREALKVAEEIGDKPEVARVLGKIGFVHESQGNYADALEHYSRSLKRTEETEDKGEIAVALSTLGNVQHLQGDHSRAIETLDRAALLAKRIGAYETLWEARNSTGKAYRALNLIDQASQAFSDAIEAVEQLRDRVAGGEPEQQRFFESRVSPYYSMIELLVDQNRIAEAFAYAQRAKGRVLLDVLTSGRVVAKAMTPHEQEEENRLRAETVSLNKQISLENLSSQPRHSVLAVLNNRLEQVRMAHEAFQTSLYGAHPNLRVQRGQVQPLALIEVPLISDSSGALLEFVVSEHKTFLFVLTLEKSPDVETRRPAPLEPGGDSRPGYSASPPAPALTVYTINIERKKLENTIRSFNDRLAGRRSNFGALASGLYDLLLRPARRQIENVSSLVIAPDNILWELPFQALKPSHDRYVIEDCALSYAPSLTVFREMKLKEGQRASVPRTLLAFGNPAIAGETVARVENVFMDEKLAPLPEAEKQVRLLRRIYGAGRSRVYVGRDAREERVKLEAGRYTILHLATHGILNDASPMYSHLVLSQTGTDSSEDGLLEAWEIMKLDLNAELVVLSACDTARGRVGAGEGVIGLSWAVFVAGSPATVVSQWKVASTSTTDLMVEFHKGLVARNRKGAAPMSKAQALRQASLKLLRSKQYKHPFYWAPFVLVGAGN